MVAGKHGGVRVSGPLCHAFIDESGTVAPFSGSHFLVIALLGTTRPRPIELLVKRALKKYGTSLASGEMKADASREVVHQAVVASHCTGARDNHSSRCG